MKWTFSILFFASGLLSAQISPYKFSKELFETYAKDTTPYKNQTTPWAFSYIGEYKAALAIWDSGHFSVPKMSVEDSLYFRSFKPVKAKEYILQRAKKEQIIIINEAHQQPMHRVFTTSLLPDLYALGFGYFCAETLDRTDTLLNERKYPALMKSGHYLSEPQYGDLVRKALQTGYKTVAYEAGITAKSGKEREIQQAQNIKKILDKDPKAKILIHCGFDHVIESDHRSWEKAMAGRVKEYTGIDPFTIDQVRLTETSDSLRDNPFFRMTRLDYYAFLIDSSGKLFNGQKGMDQYDARLYHPRTKWLNGRPHWVFENGKKPFVLTKKIKTGFPCLVFAYYAKEDRKITVPADVIELKNKDDKTALALPVGEFVILIKDINGKELEIKISNPATK